MRPSSPAASALVVGFGTSVAMWTIGFLGRIPQAPLPGYVLIPLLGAPVVLGGMRMGRVPGTTAAHAALAGFLSALLNLLVLGSVLHGAQDQGPGALAGILATLPLAAGVAAAGAVIGRGLAPRPLDATPALARVAVVATIVLVLVGGLVTSQNAGLAVVDWPNSFGYPMFLFPLARMVGGVFYEHSHRLFGSLVGLVTLTLALRVLATDRRGGAKGLAAVALLLVIGQGILGGLRVTGHFTWSDSPEVTRPSLLLAMVHGATGQVFLAVLAALAAVTSRSWHELPRGGTDGGGPGGGALPGLVVVALLVQLFLGIRLRHLGEGAMIHMTFAVVVVVAALLASARTIARYSHLPPLRKTGAALAAHAVTQLLLGVLAYVAVMRAPHAGAGTFDVIAATVHQTVGAILLANATLLAVWSHRLLPAAEPGPAATPAAARP